MLFQYANRAKTQLARAITTSDTVINIISGDGALFPALTQGEQAFAITIVSVADQSQFEICYVLRRNADTFTILRAQENTKAQKFVSGDSVSLNMSAKIFDLFPQAGYLGVYDSQVVKTIGGYKKNAILADMQTPTQLWVSLQDNNKTPPDIKATEWWCSVNFNNLSEKMTEFVSGTIGLRANDIQGISLLTNGDTGLAHYKDNNGNSWDLASQHTVNNINTDLQALKADAITGHGFGSNDTRITDIYGNDNQPKRMQANLENGDFIISARIDDVQNEINRAKSSEDNINRDLQDFKSQKAVVSSAFSNYDTRITNIRILHDKPHPHVAVIGSDGSYDHTLANIEDITDVDNDLQKFKQDAVTGHGFSNNDTRITNIWANNNTDRQRLQANLQGGKSITTATIEDIQQETTRAQQDVLNEKNRAQNVESTLISGTLGLGKYDKAGRGLITHGETGRAQYSDETGVRGEFPWASEYDAFLNKFQTWSQVVKHGDWVSFPKPLDNFINDGTNCNVSIFTNVISNVTIYDGSDNIFVCNISRDFNNRPEIEYNKFRIIIKEYYQAKHDAKGTTPGPSLVQFLAIRTD